MKNYAIENILVVYPFFSQIPVKSILHRGFQDFMCNFFLKKSQQVNGYEISKCDSWDLQVVLGLTNTMTHMLTHHLHTHTHTIINFLNILKVLIFVN